MSNALLTIVVLRMYFYRRVTFFLLPSTRRRTVHVVWISSTLGSTHQLVFLFQFLKFHEIMSMPSLNHFSPGLVNSLIPFKILHFLKALEFYFVSYLTSKVWMMLIVAIASVIFSLLYFNRLLKKKIQLTTRDEKITEMYPIRISESIYMYVVGTLLNQGKHFS